MYQVLQLEVIYDIQQLNQWQSLANWDSNVNSVKDQMNSAIDNVIANLVLNTNDEDSMTQAAIEMDKLFENVFNEINDYDPNQTFDMQNYENFKAEMEELNTYIDQHPELGLESEMDGANAALNVLDMSVTNFDNAVTDLQTANSDFESDVSFEGRSTFSQTVNEQISLSTTVYNYVDGEVRNLYLNIFDSALTSTMEPTVDG